MNTVEIEPFQTNSSNNRNSTKSNFISKFNSKFILSTLLFIGLTNCMYLFLDKVKKSHFDMMISKLLNKIILRNDTLEE